MTTSDPADVKTDAESSHMALLCPRRRLLLGIAGVGTTTLLTACGSGGSGGGRRRRGYDASDPEAPYTGPRASEDPPPLARVEDIPLGGGLLVSDDLGEVLLVRPEEGVVYGFDPRCPHQGVTVEPPTNGVIVCPQHGSRFDAENGSLLQGPASRGLEPIPVRIFEDNVIRA